MEDGDGGMGIRAVNANGSFLHPRHVRRHTCLFSNGDEIETGVANQEDKSYFGLLFEVG